MKNLIAKLQFLVVSVCTITGPNHLETCYDTLFESNTIIRCENVPQNATLPKKDPFPWEWYNGSLTLGYTDISTGEFTMNHHFVFDWGTWNVISGYYVEYIVGVDENVISRSGMEETCWTRIEP